MISFDFKYIFYYWPKMLPYLGVTFLVVVLSFIFSLALGTLLAAGKIRKNILARAFASGYTTIMRCTPSVVLLFIVYYGLPVVVYAVFHVDINYIYKGVFVIITLALLNAAPLSEVIRSAYLSIDKGQYEAAVCVGLTPFDAFRRVLFPQLFYVMLPNIGNSILALTKEGTLAFTISYIDITGKAQLIVSNAFGAHSREVYLGLAIIYLMITLTLEFGFKKTERYFSGGKTAPHGAGTA
ncbi:MAG: amino acid ABC transporter permease [Treponema sp.]|jgi:L-cystine transport system permease protein|nr:amino acid ABC transporter permease [Treponema sp.]